MSKAELKEERETIAQLEARIGMLEAALFKARVEACKGTVSVMQVIDDVLEDRND